jgi:hypothetical protein
MYNKELYDMCLSHFNEPFISTTVIARCIGYAEDDFDCYIMTKHLGGKIEYNTCVGGYTWLTGLKKQGVTLANNGEIWDDLYRLDQVLQFNGCERENKFQFKII